MQKDQKINLHIGYKPGICYDISSFSTQEQKAKITILQEYGIYS